MSDTSHSSRVFIVGLPRTASKWIQDVLNTHTECCVTHEMHVLTLWRRSGDRVIRQKVHEVTASGKTAALRELVLSERLFGSFWTSREHEYTVFCLTEAELERALDTVCDGQTMLTAMMEAQRGHYSKLRPGSRHPVHFIYLGKLLKWYPDSRVIFLTRRMTEIMRSQRARHVPEEAGWFRRTVLNSAVVLHCVIQSLLATLILWRWEKDARILRVRYSDLVEHSETTFKAICDHVEVPFHIQMIEGSRQYDSAFDEMTRQVPSYSIEWNAEGSDQ
ncbi:MAG: sulfotransferase [Anaerolineae bacterium]